MHGGVLLHDRSVPPLRTVIGALLSIADRADFAIGNVRLGAIDLTHAELGGVRSCRLLLDRLDADMLSETAAVIGLGGRLARNLEVLHAFAASGRLQVRAAGSHRWFPDFSVMHGLPVSAAAPVGSACLIGAHYFSRPVAMDGTSFTCALTSAAAVRCATTRYEQLWLEAHDVLPVIRELLQSLLENG